MVAISECEAGSAEESSPDGDLLLWPRPMRKGAGDMPGISNVSRAGGWGGGSRNSENKGACVQGQRGTKNKKRWSKEPAIDSKGEGEAAGNTRQPTIAGEERKFTSTNASAKNKGLPL
jgi:hypothetical protein